MNARMTFGKHEGVRIRDLPDGYLSWLGSILDTLSDKSLVRPIREELARRGGATSEQQRTGGRETRGSSRTENMLTRELRPVAVEIVSHGYKVLAQRHHPDAGGGHEEMVKLNLAAAALRQLVEK